MECEEYLRRSRLFRRLRSGPHGQLVERYAARLVGDGLVSHGTWRSFNVVGGLLGWIASRRGALADLDEHSVEQYLRHRTNETPLLVRISRHTENITRLWQVPLPSRAAQFGIVDPVEREQRALHAPQLAQGRGDAVLPRDMRRAAA